jgi:hypothetical protein
MNKKTDAQLLKELSINVIVLAAVMIIIFIVTTFIFTGILEEVWYRFMFLIIGLLLLSYSFQKYFQENPKVRSIIMWILLALVILGVILFIIML